MNPSVRDIPSGDDLRRAEATQQLAGYAIAGAVLVGTVGSHVSTTDGSCVPEQLVGVVAELDDTGHGDERERRHFIVHAERRTRIAAQGPTPSTIRPPC